MPTEILKAALIGQGIGGSLTPAMHEAEARAQGFAYHYSRFDTATPEYAERGLSELIETAKNAGFSGLNITHPFKSVAATLVDEKSENVQMLGALNTIVFENGRSIGHNTDYLGFRAAFNSSSNIQDLKRVLLIGAGGAGAAVGLALVDQGVATLLINDADSGKAKELATRLQKARPNAEIAVLSQIEAQTVSGLSGIVNATPMGMEDHPGEAIELGLISPTTWVADIVYFPLLTSLLQKAGAKGCPVMGGGTMAIHQAVEAFGLITGRRANAARMEDVFNQIQSGKMNQVSGGETV